MQTCTAEILLGGNVKSTAILENVTPPEVQILRALHGQNSVIYRGQRDEKKHSHHEEIARLQEKYKTSSPNIGAAKIPVFSMVFPGSSPTLPIRFSEIGFGEQEVEQRILPDKPGFHGDPKPDVQEIEGEQEEEEEGDKEAEGELPATPKKNKGGRPKKVQPD